MKKGEGDTREDDAIDNQQLALGDLLNPVLDKGLVIGGTVTISVADIDLLLVDLRVLLSSVETVTRRGIERTHGAITPTASPR